MADEPQLPPERPPDQQAATADGSRSWAARLRRLPKKVWSAIGVLVIVPLGLWAVETYGPKTASKVHVFSAKDAPVLVTVEEEPTTETFRIPKGQKIPSNAPKRCNPFISWLLQHGGIADESDTIVRVTVQSKTTDQAVIESVTPKVIARTAPVPGIIIRADNCPVGGGLPATDLDWNLDRSARIGRRFQPRSVSANDSDVFFISTTALEHTYRWLVELDVVKAGHRYVIDVGDRHTGPFTTIGGRISSFYFFYEGAFYEEGNDPETATKLPGPPLNP